MFFKRIEMHGFKSFAEPVTIEFDRGITCVVGPNGSGKSNISDAIRWVLGEQSPKMLRGGKMEDVIFAGTASRKSRGMAEVTLVIDNSNGCLPIEYQEVAITRRMYRSGESEYAINNNQCRMRDIRELLMDTGIGVDGYSLIGQGKISDIISNKTDSIREIFEETAGIVSYRSKKAEAEKKLESSNINMDRVNDIISEIESRIDDLREDSQKATEYIQLRDRYKELEVNITINNIEDITEKIKVLSDDLEVLTKNLSESNLQKEQLDEKISYAKDELDKIEESITKINQELKVKGDLVNQLTNEKNISRERIYSIEKDILRINNEIKDTISRLEEEEKVKESLLREKADIEMKSVESEEILQKETLKFNEKTDEKISLSLDIDDNKNRLFDLSKDKSGWIAEKNSLIRLEANLDDSKEDILNKKEEAKKEIEQFIEEKETILSEIEISQKNLEEMKSQFAKLDISKDLKTKENNQLQRDIDAINHEINHKSARKKTIKEMESNYEGYNGGVRFLMKSDISGIHGVVAELMTVPKGFEIAIETALGATMQNIVCNDDKTAKEAIEILKEKKAGRVTLLPVLSIKSKGPIKDNKIENAKGFEGYGVDCVSFDVKYKNIFEYLLGNVAIVNNMSDAINISKMSSKGLKIVTLDGEIINNAGAITGGKYKNKTANILERKSEINILDKEIEELISKEANMKIIRDENLEELDKISLSIDDLLANTRRIEVEILNSSNRLELLNKSILSGEETLRGFELSLLNISQQEESFKSNLEELDNKINLAEKDILTTEENIKTYVDKLDEVNKQLDGLNDSITKARIQVITCNSEKENINNLVYISQNNIRNYTDEINNKKEHIENIKMDKEGLNGGLEKKETEVARLKIENEKAQSKLINMIKNKEDYYQIYDEAFKTREEVNKKAVGFQDQKYDIDIKLARQESQLDNFKNKIWEDFEISYAQALTLKSSDFVMSSAIRENREIKNRIKELGEVNVGAIKEYAQVKERYEFLLEQREDVQKSTDELKRIIGDMDKIIKEKFKESFDQIVDHFEKIFVEFFGGGHGNITLDNEDDPLNATIEITAQPPGKQLKNINLLSGGEKTMTAIALMFAVLKTKPTPCCILDEVEAALDDHNIHVFANYLKKFDNIQFTLITHQKTTMEHADVMYGVTMPERGISKVFSLKMDDELPV